jgi:ribosome-binding protein aMBF1 (putative translation factor)
MKKIKFISHKEMHARLMRRPGFKKAYDDLDFEFTLLRALIDARAKRGMTQEKLAKKIGTKQSAIARFETGRANPTFAFVQKLSDALDLKITATPRYAKR